MLVKIVLTYQVITACLLKQSLRRRLNVGNGKDTAICLKLFNKAREISFPCCIHKWYFAHTNYDNLMLTKL
ncbi:hypothetical protein D3C77_343250 [compost metagenome]